MNAQELTGSSPMPFGKHKGKEMAKVPAEYLLWLFDQGCKNEPVRRYILDNLQAIRQEAKMHKQWQR